MQITKAEKSDLTQILKLQYLAYQSEAKLYNDYSIPPLKQTLEELHQEYEKSLILKATDESGEIIGSVRAYTDNGTAYIGRVIVHTNRQGQGIGTKLINTVERESSATRYELFTGSKSAKNLRLYEYLGYKRFREQEVANGLILVYLEKYAGDL